jgi:Ca2+-binding RTX toxin-like protein
MDSTYVGAFTSGATRITVNSSVNGGATPISANTALVQNPIFQSDVPGVWLSTSGDLFIAGTPGNDKISVTPKTVKINKVLTPQIIVTLNGTKIGTFNTSTVTGRIIARGLGGNDVITVNSKITQGADLYGGTGNDTLTGGAGDDRLFGEDGNDRLTGGKGHNLLVGGAGDDRLTNGGTASVLIGGSGADTITAGKGGDLLIAGSTAFESDLTDLSKLMDIFNEWTSTVTPDYNTRISHLKGPAGGLNGTTFLNASTVSDDGVKDVLMGGKGLDWFVVSALDKFTVKTGEQPPLTI